LTPSEAGKGEPKYSLKFVPDALKEWQALDGSIKEPLRKALKERTINMNLLQKCLMSGAAPQFFSYSMKPSGATNPASTNGL